MGADCKIMACRTTNEVSITVSIPQVSSYVASADEYMDNLQTVQALIQREVKKSPFEKVNLTLNPGDDTDKEMLYLRLTGSCIESGDEGQVSRGNRLGGVISSRRPFSIEGLSGKNPSYHAGKLYSVAAWEIATKISNQQRVPCEVFIISQIDRPLDDPWKVVINSVTPLDTSITKNIYEDVLGNLSELTRKLLEGKYPLV